MKSTKQSPDIVFIPPVTNPVLKSDEEDFLPVGLLALMSSLKVNDFSSDIYKPSRILYTEQDYQEMACEILDLEPKSVGFSTWCHSFPSSILIARELKKSDPHVPVIFGGPQVSMVGRETLRKYPFIDYVLKGEADSSLPKLMSCLLNETSEHELKKIEGIVYYDNSSNAFIDNNFDCNIPDLDELPIPEYTKIFRKKYLNIDAGRGCPFKCKFCSTTRFFSRTFRLKSVDRIIEEMDYCYKELKTRVFGFTHDMLTLRKEFIFELCGKLQEHFRKTGVNYTWSCSLRSDCVTEEMLDAMWEAGCRSLFIGIESASPRMQRNIGKNLDIKDAHNKIEYAGKLGFRTRVSYIMGFPLETRLDIDQSIRSALYAAYTGNWPQAALLSILPGTDYYDSHLNELYFDGYTSGFSSIVESEPVMQMVREDKKLFSSFYYLKSSEISRDILILISEIINILPQFIPTIRSIWESLAKDIERISLVSLLQDSIIKQETTQKKDDYELELFTNGLLDYLAYLDKKPGFNPVIFDIFLMDSMKAIVQRHYLKWQVIRAVQDRPKEISKAYQSGDKLDVVPIWKIVTTRYNVYRPVKYPLEDWDQHRFRRGSCQFLLVPVNDFQVAIHRVKNKYRGILSQLKSMTVDSFIELCSPGLDEIEANRLLKRLLAMNMVEIVKD